MTAPQPEQVRAYLAAMAAYQAQTATLRATVAAAVTRSWRLLGSWRQTDVSRFVREVTPIVLGGQRAMQALTTANLARQRQIALGGTARPVAVDARAVTGSAARNGVSPATVYERPFHLVWRQLHDLPRESGAIDQAIQSGLDRAVESAQDDLQLTKKLTARDVLRQDERVVGYRRVLEGAYSCGLCIVAATRRYDKDELLPIHGRCDCSVNAIYGTSDPGISVAATVRAGDGRLVPIGEIADIHERIAERFGDSSTSAGAKGAVPDYRDVLITHEHNELGPVLAVRGAGHKSLAELKRDTAAAN